MCLYIHRPFSLTALRQILLLSKMWFEQIEYGSKVPYFIYTSNSSIFLTDDIVTVVTRVNPSWLPTLGPSLSTYSKPLKLTAAAKAGKIAVIPRFGPYDWELPMTTTDK
jgi:hypothetical protein